MYYELMDLNRYRSMPLNPERFVLVHLPSATKRSWLKVDDTGLVLEASPNFRWAAGLAIETVEKWCDFRSLSIRHMHGNIKNIKPYL